MEQKHTLKDKYFTAKQLLTGYADRAKDAITGNTKEKRGKFDQTGDEIAEDSNISKRQPVQSKPAKAEGTKATSKGNIIYEKSNNYYTFEREKKDFIAADTLSDSITFILAHLERVQQVAEDQDVAEISNDVEGTVFRKFTNLVKKIKDKDQTGSFQELSKELTDVKPVRRLEEYLAKLSLSFKICLLKNQGASEEEGKEITLKSMTELVLNGVNDGSIDLESDSLSSLFAKLIYEDSYNVVDSNDIIKQKFESEKENIIQSIEKSSTPGSLFYHYLVRVVFGDTPENLSIDELSENLILQARSFLLCKL